MNSKKLFLVRHAKAEDFSFSKSDFNRDLMNKGIDRAQRIAQACSVFLQADHQTLFISSTANRAIQTAAIFCNTLGYPYADILQTEHIYEASFLDILKEINKTPATIQTVVVFGHNPGLSDLANYICNSYIDLNTSAVAEIELEENIDFCALSENTGTLVQVIRE